jgi:hypothetical protein
MPVSAGRNSSIGEGEPDIAPFGRRDHVSDSGGQRFKSCGVGRDPETEEVFFSHEMVSHNLGVAALN